MMPLAERADSSDSADPGDVRNGSIRNMPTRHHAPVAETELVDNSMSMISRYITVAILFLVNLLNYMDRYTIAGVLKDVKSYYHIDDASAGFLQAIFIVGYMIFSPIFGYCGDRYSRKYLMLGGILFWSAVTMGSSFVPPKYFGVFVLLRGMVGIGEASYSTIAPTLISDMFIDSKRSAMLMLFYFAIPVGSGLGYIVGSEVARLAGAWYWALRVTPGLGVVCCILIFFVSKDPPRGMAEHAAPTRAGNTWVDVKALLKNKSFMLDTFGFVCVAFVAGALALFAPLFILSAYKYLHLETSQSTISFYFGLVTATAGFVGIMLGSGLAYLAKKRFPSGDALVCGFGLSTASVFLFLAIFLIEYSVAAAWVLTFLALTMTCTNWPLAADILLYTVVPTRRSKAQAMNIFMGHLLGDAGSPYLIGLFADYLQHSKGYSEFKAMQTSLYSCAVVAMIGGVIFFACSLFIKKDRARADAITHGATEREADRVVSPEVLINDGHSDDEAPLLVAT